MPAGDNEAKRNAEYNPLTDTCIKAFDRRRCLPRPAPLASSAFLLFYISA
jgi:hypothetical protein